MTSEEKTYLDELRKSGVTNMWGAGLYLQDEFNLDEREADEVFQEWKRTFDA